MNHFIKRKSIYVPIVLVLVLFGLLTGHQAIQNRSLVPDGLSRSIPVVSSVKGETYNIAKHNDGYELYVNQNGKVTYFSINENLTTTKTKTLPINVSTSGSFSKVGENVYFLDDEKLSVFDGSKTNLIAEHVGGMRSVRQEGFYWMNNKVYQLDTGQSEPIIETDGKIDKLSVGEDGSTLAVGIPRDDLTTDCYFYQLEGGKWTKANSFSVNNASGQFLSDIEFYQHDGMLEVLYVTAQNAKGEISYRGYFGSFQREADTAEFEKVDLYNAKTRERLSTNIDYQLVSTDGGDPMIVFSGRGKVTPKKDGWNIYRAKLHENRWLAERISTTKNVSTNPQWVDQNEVFWLNSRGDQTKVMAVTDVKPIVAQSHHFHWEDWKEGVFNSLGMLSYGLIILLFAVMWLAPSFGFLFVVSFWNEEAIEENRNWVLYSVMGIFIMVQLILMSRFFTPAFELFAPDYLTYPLYTYTLPLILAALSFLVLKLVGNGGWNLYMKTGYFAMVNLIFIMFLISPYMI